MPWTAADAEGHTKKADTPKRQETWAKVANSRLRQCIANIDGSPSEQQRENCEASAIKVANAMIGNMGEADMLWFELAQQAIETARACINDSVMLDKLAEAKGVSALQMANKMLDELEADCATALLEEAEWTTAYVNDLPDSSFALVLPGGEKDEEGKTKPRSLRRLPYKDKDGTVDLPHLRNALARLPQLEGVTDAQRASARKKLEAEAKKHLETHQEEAAEATVEETAGGMHDIADRVEDAFHSQFSPRDRWEGPYRVRDVFSDDKTLGTSVIVLHRDEGVLYAAGYTLGDDGAIEFSQRGEWKPVVLGYFLKSPQRGAEEEAGESLEDYGQAVEVARDATDEDTAVLNEAEAALIDATARRKPVVVDFQVLKPGPGNKHDRRYYSADVLKRDIHVFSGVDVFATDHREAERSERTKVGTVLAVPTRFTSEHAPVASVLIYDPAQAEKTRNRADAGQLSTLECSIFGTGRVKKGKVNGEEYNVVEAITHGKYLELVSKAGAGGKALNLAEVEIGGDEMKDKEKVEAPPVGGVQEVEIEEAETGEQHAETTHQPQALAESEVDAALAETNLPELAKRAVKAGNYETADTLKQAIDAWVAEVKRLSGSGEVSGLGESDSPPGEQLSLNERDKRGKEQFNAVMQEMGLKEV